jgi:drug/metabolite transporter (DMT)-like permease
MNRHPVVPPLLVLAFGILAVSTSSILIRNAQEFAPSLVISAYRLLFATLVLAPFAAANHRTELAGMQRADFRFTILSGLFLALHFAAWITSLEYTTVASSVVLVTTTPLWVALLSPLTIKEPIARPVWVGLILALLGGLVVGLSDTCSLNGLRLSCPPVSEFVRQDAFWGDLLALAGAWMAAGYILIGRRLRQKLSLVGYIFVVYGIAALVLIIVMFAAGQNLFGYPSEAYLWMILIALVPQLLGHSSFNWALGYLSAAYVSISLLGEPIGSTILAYFLLDESPTALKIFGAILILVGIYLVSRSQR